MNNLIFKYRFLSSNKDNNNHKYLCFGSWNQLIKDNPNLQNLNWYRTGFHKWSARNSKFQCSIKANDLSSSLKLKSDIMGCTGARTKQTARLHKPEIVHINEDNEEKVESIRKRLREVDSDDEKSVEKRLKNQEFFKIIANSGTFIMAIINNFRYSAASYKHEFILKFHNTVLNMDRFSEKVYGLINDIVEKYNFLKATNLSISKILPLGTGVDSSNTKVYGYHVYIKHGIENDLNPMRQFDIISKELNNICLKLTSKLRDDKFIIGDYGVNWTHCLWISTIIDTRPMSLYTFKEIVKRKLDSIRSKVVQITNAEQAIENINTVNMTILDSEKDE
jgi:hypothetical protein